MPPTEAPHLGLELLLLILEEVLVYLVLLFADVVLPHVAKHEECEGVRVAQDATRLEQLLKCLINRVNRKTRLRFRGSIFCQSTANINVPAKREGPRGETV